MRINKFLFPLILLVIFIDVIALGMALGYWETKGGRGRGPQSEILAPTYPLNSGEETRFCRSAYTKNLVSHPPNPGLLKRYAPTTISVEIQTVSDFDREQSVWPL